MKLINRKTSDYYRTVSLEALTPVSEPSYEIKEEVNQDYTLYEKIVSNLNLTENMLIALECRQNGLSYPEISRVLSRASDGLRILHQNAAKIYGNLRIVEYKLC